MIAIRESFGAKLLSALLGTVGLLLIVTFLVVRVVTANQVQQVTARTTQNAGTLFEERNELQRQVVARLARPFTEGTRAALALGAAIADDDFDLLAGEIEYEMDLQEATNALVVFTNDEGLPVLTIVGRARFEGGDPAQIQPLAEQLLADEVAETRAYRVVDGTVYNVRSLAMRRGYRQIGTASFGLPVLPADVAAIGSVGGFEACLHFAGECALQTARVDESEDLRDAMLASVGRSEPLRISSAGSEWSIRSEPLIAARPSEGDRVVAVPLDPVLAPFERIQQSLLFGGGGALLLSVLLGTVLSRNLTRPVRALVEATGRVAEGDYETEVSVDSEDELGTLAGAFNEMTRGLLVREQYRSVLSKVVSQDIAEELMRGSVELGGENREISVLFADIRGFTPLTEGMEPQEVIGLLNECMEKLASAVDLEGGVVDKFIGDEVMAVFGAPVTQPDHALRAVGAAVRMRDGIEEMNIERRARGEQTIGVGIGVATGLAVAGNMGSTDRLNYTVLGSTVNLAARITSAAGAGEVLISGETLEAAGRACVAQSIGRKSLKGFSSDVEVYTVHKIDRSVTREAETQTLRALPSVPAVALVAGGFAAAAGSTPLQVEAQWPTLADAGIGYISESGSFQMDLSGQMDLEGLRFSSDTDALSGLAFGSSWLLAPRVRLFLDTFVGDHVYALVEWRGDRGEAPTADFWEARLEQAFLRVTTRGGGLSLQAGIFASPFGSYTQRHLSIVDPFIRPPLPYDYRTVISRRWSPPNEEWFLRWKRNPQEWRSDGAPPVWGVPYQWGGMGTVTLGFLSVRVAGMNNAPSSEPLDWYELEVIEDEVSWVTGLQAKVTPELVLGWSYNTGPYLGSDVPNRADLRAACCPGYDQAMWSADAAFARGPLVLRAEVIHDSWDVPNVDDDAIDIGFSMEAQVDLAPGWSLALRYGKIDFQALGDTGEDWDFDVTRREAALGYRIVRNAGIMTSIGLTTSALKTEPSSALGAVRLWWGF